MATANANVSRGTQTAARIEGYPAGGLRFDWMAAFLSTLFMGGLFIDGWAHNHGKVDQSFFTVWHFLFYSAFGMAALFLGYNTWRNVNKGYTFRQALPRGYWLSLVGVVVFAVGGVGDLIWHTLFGIEANTEALLSPTHLILAVGMALIWSGPIRSAWNRLAPNSTPGWRQAGPMIVAVTLVLALLMFFTQFAHPIDVPLAAFGEHQAAQTPHADIYAMNLDGTGQTRVTVNQSGEDFVQPTLSPDGTKMLFSRYNPTTELSDLYIANGDGQNAHPLVAHDGDTDSLSEGSWSPDGEQIAFVWTKGDTGGLYVVNADGSNIQQLTTGDAGVGTAWSPDGSKIAYSQQDSDNWNIYVINADGSDQQTLANGSGHEVWPMFSPDGSTIVYSVFGNDSPPAIVVANADGTHPSTITGDQSGWFGIWSHDGQQIVFLSNRDGSDEIYSMNADGSNVQNLSNSPGLQFNSPMVTPDGSKILYTAQAAGGQQDGDFNLSLGIASVLIQAGLLMGMILLLVQHWRLPFGAITLIVTASSLLISFMQDTLILVPAMLIAGLLADVLLRVLQPSSERSGQFYLFAFLTPVLIYACYFIALLLTMGITWSIHATAGAIFLAGIVGLLLAFVIAPPFGTSEKVAVANS